MTLLRRITLAVLWAATLTSCSKYEEVSYEIGYKGEARFNPFLAASRLLERFAYSAERSTSISRLPDYETTIVLPAESVSSFSGAKRLHSWVEDGGHLIYLMSGYGRSEGNSFWEVLGGREHPLLEAFGVDLVTAEDSGDDAKVRVHSRELSAHMPSTDAISVPQHLSTPDVTMDSTDNSRLVSMPLRRGRFTIISNAQPFRNRHIENRDHARLILELVELHRAHSVLFIHGKGTSFMKMLLHYAWMPLLGLAVLTLLWIWKNLPRFGPVIPQIDGSSRQFTEHIEMSGRFLWRHKASAALLAPLVTHIHRTFQEKYPHVDDSVDAHIEYFDEHTDLPREEISEALMGLPVKDPASMTRIVKNLKLLSESL